MSALDLLEDFGFEAAVVVIGPEGVRAARGDLDLVRPWRSVTKTLTGVAVAVALQEGRVALEDPTWPPGATLRHLLSHASGCFHGSRRILTRPGTRRAYSNYGIDEAARHLEAAIGRDIGDWVQDRVTGPLGMDRTEWTGSASVGASGPLRDLTLFAAEVLRPTLLRPRWHREMTEPSFPDLKGVMPGFGFQDPNPFGLAVEIKGAKTPHWTPTRASPRTVGHFGMLGTAFWVDPVADLALVIGTSRTFCDAHRVVLPRLGDAVLEEYAGAPGNR